MFVITVMLDGAAPSRAEIQQDLGISIIRSVFGGGVEVKIHELVPTFLAQHSVYNDSVSELKVPQVEDDKAYMHGIMSYQLILQLPPIQDQVQSPLGNLVHRSMERKGF